MYCTAGGEPLDLQLQTEAPRPLDTGEKLAKVKEQ